ncbi:bifunctional 4-hydroxy-2-oxoglutarate aldolase/2-dehydro-3-deoxy-phosphogluconate aldolase [Candidatus Latescibacterota bacterium]
MLSKHEVLTILRDTGVVGVIRTEKPKDLVAVSRAIRKGGVKFIEITMTVPGAIGIIEEAVKELKDEDVFIGAGTVLDPETARAAIIAGSSFIVAPVLNIDVVKLCKRYGIVVMPAGFTPLEIFTAWQAGADVVKVFPANQGGPQFFKDVKGPLPQIELLPTGGVNLETAPEFIKAGACAVGVGGAMVGKQLIVDGDFETITNNTRKFLEIVKKAKETLKS